MVSFKQAIGLISNFSDELAKINCIDSATEISEIKNDLIKGMVTYKTKCKLAVTIELLEKELSDFVPIGKDYRKRCFEDFMLNILEAIKILEKKRDNTFFETIVLPIYIKAMDVEINIHPILKIEKEIIEKQIDLRNLSVANSEKDRAYIFNMLEHTYVQLIEGIFDELVRLYYFFVKTASGSKVTIDQINNLKVRAIIKKLESKPIFLYNWEDKTCIRNAIAHAKAKYNPEDDIANFDDINKKVKCSLFDFFLLHQELLEMLVAFRASLMIFIIADTLVYVEQNKGKNFELLLTED